MTGRLEFEELNKIVERNIVKLFKIFQKNPAIFLSESDVQCYLYSLLINDPEIRDFHPNMINFSATMETSKSIFVHANMRVSIRNKNRIVDLSVFPPKETLDLTDNDLWDNMIGIEIKFNRRVPARKESSNIMDDIKKVSDYKKGYVLWLNWDREIDDDNLKKVEKFAEKHANVRVLYLDLFSDPIKTNVSEISLN
jgi:hypothetical protein